MSVDIQETILLYGKLKAEISECAKRTKINKEEMALLEMQIRTESEALRKGEKSMTFGSSGTIKWRLASSIQIGDGTLTPSEEKKAEARIILQIIEAKRGDDFVNTKITQALNKDELKKDLEFIDKIENLSVVQRESFSITPK